MAEYNIKTVICFAFVIAGVIWLVTDMGRKSDKHIFKVICRIICPIIVIALVVTMLFSVSFRSSEITGTVKNITCTGSPAGALDTYTVEIEKLSGDTIRLHTSLFSSKRIKKVIVETDKGSKVRVSYGGYFDMIYDIKPSEAD